MSGQDASASKQPGAPQVRFYIFCMIVFVSLSFKTFALAQETAVPKDEIGMALKNFGQLSASDKNMVLGTSGLPQLGSFDWGKTIGCAIFGGIGFIAFIYGKKNSFWRPMIIGIALMAYPYFLSGTLAVYLAGIGLVAVLYFWRD